MQPIFSWKKKQLVRNKIPAWSGLPPTGAFTSENAIFCSKKEQKRRQRPVFGQGATDSAQIGCTLFTLLHRIRGQGATVLQDWFIG
ncbi:hypothetical protein [Pseudomonas protegens]|uniref:hypothetical protein n=1 Tax=Pseudomonas protegens TaxID=380021 RepID=UPI00118765D9|nr:hypothetical protein [Pseudomonas protegens]